MRVAARTLWTGGLPAVCTLDAGCLCAKAAQRDKSAAALLLDERVPLDDRFEVAARILCPVHVATGRHADVVSIDELRAAREAALVRDNDDDEGEDTCG